MTVKHRGALPLPELGEGAHLRFTLEDMAKLSERYGGEKDKDGDWAAVLVDRIKRNDVPTMLDLLKLALKGADFDGAKAAYDGDPWFVGDLERHLLDAITRSMHGRTLEEQIEHEDQEMAREIERRQKNPILRKAMEDAIAGIASKGSFDQHSEQDSDPTTSGV